MGRLTHRTAPNFTYFVTTKTSLKGGASHAIHQSRGIKIQIWASGFHESSIRDRDDYLRKAAYIRENPLEAHLAEKPEDWSYGSASGAFRMDELPLRSVGSFSGAKAPHSNRSGNVGAKAPTP
jgi:hypothetical protein